MNAPRSRPALHSEPLFASKRIAELSRQCLIGLLVVMLTTLPLTMWMPRFQLPRGVVLILHLVGAAGVSLSVGLRSRHHRKAVYLSTACVSMVMGTHLLNTGLGYSGAALVVMVAPMLMLGLEHRRRGVMVATALAVLAVALAVAVELGHPPDPQHPRSVQDHASLLLGSSFACLALLTVGFLIDRVLDLLRYREEFLTGVLSNIGTAVLVYDVDERGELYLTAMNSAYEDALAVSAPQLLGRSRSELVGLAPIQGPNAPSASSVVRTKRAATGELIHSTNSGRREFAVSAAPQLDESGEVRRVVVCATDISAHRQAERQLRFQADVLASIHDAVIATDAQGVITYMNRAAERLYRQKPGSGVGTALAAIAGAEFQRAALAEARHEVGVVRSGQFLRADQAVVPIEYTVSKLLGEGGEAAGTLAVIRDVSERRALQAQLLAAQKQEALGRLAGGVAHDFNNLLVVIRGSAEFVHADLPADHASQPDILEVLRAADRAAGLVRQLLTFARRRTPSPRSVALSKVLGDLVQMLRRLIREEIQLSIEVERDLWSVKVDVAQIEQVIVNLLVNARDAIPGAGRITLRTRNAQLGAGQAEALAVPPGDYVLLEVHDTGVGMNAETMKHIFEPFFSTKVTGAGTGLGLAVCYGIITELGGGIMADSTPGKGSAFTIALPRSHELPGSATGPQNLLLPGGSETILVVEDDQAVRELAVRVLRTQGYRVHEAADGAAALSRAAALGDERIDLLFTDMILPRMGGQELAHQLVERRPGLAVLLASGYGDSGPAAAALGDSVRAFLAKPYGPAALLQSVRAVLDAARQARGEAPASAPPVEAEP